MSFMMEMVRYANPWFEIIDASRICKVLPLVKAGAPAFHSTSDLSGIVAIAAPCSTHGGFANDMPIEGYGGSLCEPLV
ncbi:MAG TPA: hypothetical protein VJ652_12555 [Noviherbaspirillum sp.]|nr:hypothetical protein [Noviherbaspirillum sp.]